MRAPPGQLHPSWAHRISAHARRSLAQGALHAPQACVHWFLEGRRAQSGVGTLQSVWPCEVHDPLWSWTPHVGPEQGSDPGPGRWGDPASLRGPRGCGFLLARSTAVPRASGHSSGVRAARGPVPACPLTLQFACYSNPQPLQRWAAGVASRVSAGRWRRDTLLSPLPRPWFWGRTSGR